MTNISTSPVLSDAEIDAYWRDGYVFVADALTPAQLDALRSDFAAWVDESREHTEPYGITQDGRPRFDLQPGHSADHPALRRVASPVEVSEAYLSAMRDNRALDAAEASAAGGTPAAGAAARSLALPGFDFYGCCSISRYP